MGQSSNHFQLLCTSGLLATLLASCGSNLYQSLEPLNPAVDAVRALENHKPQNAIDLLTTALGETFKSIYLTTNSSNVPQKQAEMAAELTRLIESSEVKDAANLASLLASARAALHGIDELQVALKMATKDESDEAEASDSSGQTPSESAESDEGNENDLTILFPALPDATSSNIEGAQVAVAILRAVGGYSTDVDDFKLALYQVASLSLATKTLDTDGDGSISTAESILISPEAAASIISQMLAASIAASQANATEEGSASADAASKIGSLYGKVQESEGETDAEKLSNYLSGNN